MKAAVFLGTHQVEIMQRPIPALEPHQILVEVHACGICGTDIHIFNGAEGAAKTTPPTILGHEFAGIVAAVGSAVTMVQPGDHVCIDPNEMCGGCAPCKTGLGHYCEHMTGYGTTSDGGFAQFCVVPEKQAYVLEPSVPFDIGCMAEPISCCLHGIDMCQITTGNTVLVIGGGPIGQLMLQLAKLAGAAVTILSEPVATKREMALKLGTDYAFDPLTEHVDALLEQKGLIPNVVIECVGRKQTMLDAIHLAGNKSLVMLFGLGNPADEIPIRPFELFKKELTIRASYINPYTMERAVKLINRNTLKLAELIGSVISLEQLPQTLASQEAFAGGKVIVHPQE